MRVAYAEIAPGHRPHIDVRGPGIFNRLTPDGQDVIFSTLQDSPQPIYMNPRVYRLEEKLPIPLELARRIRFQKVELRVMQSDETITTGAVIAEFTPLARHFHRIQRHVERIAEKIPVLRRKIQKLHENEVGEITENGIRIPITESSMVYLTHSRFARNAAEFLNEATIINEVQGILYLTE